MIVNKESKHHEYLASLKIIFNRYQITFHITVYILSSFLNVVTCTINSPRYHYLQ